MPEVADIFRTFGQGYRREHRLPLRMHKVMNAIENCRTAALGGHVDECDKCGHVTISYNSCRNRHCPKCQGLAREKWIISQKENLLSTNYFHVVFTIPDSLNEMALRNQREVYSIMFKACSRTLLELAEDKKYLGAKIGFITILHTWGQNLIDHNHIHCIVPGGGLSLDGSRWIGTRKDFFIPVKVMSRVFRGKFLDYLKESYEKNRLRFDGTISELKKKYKFKELLDKLYKTKWVVYCKPPFKNPGFVLEYLGRYSHRVAISNSRIVDIKDGKVTFKWRDYKDDSKEKYMILDANEFIRRFLLHILPDSFVKIRHYGFLSNRNRKQKLKLCRRLLDQDAVRKEYFNAEEACDNTMPELREREYDICPCCKIGRLSRKIDLNPRYYIPPDREITTVS
jgi:hypothetical protein